MSSYYYCFFLRRPGAFWLLSAVSLLPETFSAFASPSEEMLARALKGNPHLQQFRIAFIIGIRSGVLSRLDRSSIEQIVSRGLRDLKPSRR